MTGASASTVTRDLADLVVKGALRRTGDRRHHPLLARPAVLFFDGLAAFHAANISHNDLKPRNILVDKSSGAAKITDFGSCRRLEDVWVWTRRQGAEAYMAPEVALEGKRARDGSDIYSIGVL